MKCNILFFLGSIFTLVGLMVFIVVDVLPPKQQRLFYEGGYANAFEMVVSFGVALTGLGLILFLWGF